MHTAVFHVWRCELVKKTLPPQIPQALVSVRVVPGLVTCETAQGPASVCKDSREGLCSVWLNVQFCFADRHSRPVLSFVWSPQCSAKGRQDEEGHRNTLAITFEKFCESEWHCSSLVICTNDHSQWALDFIDTVRNIFINYLKVITFFTFRVPRRTNYYTLFFLLYYFYIFKCTELMLTEILRTFPLCNEILFLYPKIYLYNP